MGNGYPDQDEKTGSFVERYGKAGSVVEEQAFVAQERYLDQFFRHVNPYTRKSYGEDPFVIAAEINNEPKHSGSKSRATEYVNRMVKAVRQTGWSKPIFYNISESPMYADAVAASNADGFSFQWYPTGLVAGHEQEGNLLPHVNRYNIPFDSIPAFRNKPRMIYEFESADVLKPYMYPAMARSFKTAGMQWATQFAYDPMGTAHANTEYQTHYLNLAYTPSKAISLLIASRIFHSMPAYKNYGSFPANSKFAGFKLDHKAAASEMNTEKEFYYTSGSSSKPVKLKALKHIAGVGSSSVLKYQGNGAYFLDKVEDGIWRLEMMPDVLKIADPFGKNELDNPATTTVWNTHPITITLPDLGNAFEVVPLNAGNTQTSQAIQGKFTIAPGTYLLQRKGRQINTNGLSKIGVLGLREFVAPERTYTRNGEMIAKQTQKVHLGNTTKLVLFDGTNMDGKVSVYSPEWETDPYAFVWSDEKGGSLNLTHKPSGKGQSGGFQVYVQQLLSTAGAKMMEFKYITLLTEGMQESAGRVILIDEDANAVSTAVRVSANGAEIKLPINSFTESSFMLLPRPYPGFQELYYKRKQQQPFDITKLEKIQFLLSGDDQQNEVRIRRIELVK